MIPFGRALQRNIRMSCGVQIDTQLHEHSGVTESVIPTIGEWRWRDRLYKYLNFAHFSHAATQRHDRPNSRFLQLR